MIKKLLELISKYSKSQDMKLMHKSQLLSYIHASNSNKQLEFEINKTIPFKVASSQNEILRFKSNKICAGPVYRKQ